MKKFQNIVAATSIILIATFLFITGCAKNDKNPSSTSENLIYEPKSKMSYNFKDQTELNTLVEVIANEPKKIEILQAKIADYEDSEGAFKAISAKYTTDEGITNLVVPLSQSQNAKGSASAMYVVQECEMKCTSAWGCQECTQTIIERCKSQTCSCTSGNGGCSSKITFPSSQ